MPPAQPATSKYCTKRPESWPWSLHLPRMSSPTSVTSAPARRTRPLTWTRTTPNASSQSLRGSVTDQDAKATFTAKQYLLTALIADQHLDDAGLDAFQAQARRLAGQWLA